MIGACQATFVSTSNHPLLTTVNRLCTLSVPVRATNIKPFKISQLHEGRVGRERVAAGHFPIPSPPSTRKKPPLGLKSLLASPSLNGIVLENGSGICRAVWMRAG